MDSTGISEKPYKKWYKKWWGVTILVLGGLWLIGLVSEQGSTESSTQTTTTYKRQLPAVTTPEITAPPVTVPPTTQGLSPERLAYLTIIATVPAYEDAGATESQVWDQLRIVCDGFDGGLEYYEIGTILVEAADQAGISPFGYEEAGAVVGTATTVRCPEYDGWQN